MIKYLKNNLVLVIAVIILIALGTFCILISGNDIYKAFSIFALVYLVAVGGWMIYSSFHYKNYLEANPTFLNRPLGYLIQGGILIILGVLILIFPRFLVRLLIGLLLIAQPLVTLITTDDKLNYLKYNFWKFIVGLIFILAIDIVLDILFIIIGVGLILFAAFIIYVLIINYKDRTYPNVITKYIVIYINKKNK